MKRISISDLPEIGVSHNPEIKKKVILEKGYIPSLMTFGQATFQPGQSVEEHAHETMYEVFYIQSGKACFVVNGEEVVVSEGQCVAIEPKEVHSQDNPFDIPVTWLYFGIAV